MLERFAKCFRDFRDPTLIRHPADAAAGARYRKVVYQADEIADFFVDAFLDAHRRPPEELTLDLDSTAESWPPSPSPLSSAPSSTTSASPPRLCPSPRPEALHRPASPPTSALEARPPHLSGRSMGAPEQGCCQVVERGLRHGPFGLTPRLA